jgi:hypothetical protein
VRRAIILGIVGVLLTPAAASATIRRFDFQGSPTALAATPAGILVAAQMPWVQLTRISWAGYIASRQRFPLPCADSRADSLDYEDYLLFLQIAVAGNTIALSAAPEPEDSRVRHGGIALAGDFGTRPSRTLECGPYTPSDGSDFIATPMIVGDGQHLVEARPTRTPAPPDDTCDDLPSDCYLQALRDPLSGAAFATLPEWLFPEAMSGDTLVGVDLTGRLSAYRISDGARLYSLPRFQPEIHDIAGVALTPRALVVCIDHGYYSTIHIYDPQTGAPRAIWLNIHFPTYRIVLLGNTVAWIGADMHRAGLAVYVRPLDGHTGRRVLARLPNDQQPMDITANSQGIAWATRKPSYYSGGTVWIASGADVRRVLR